MWVYHECIIAMLLLNSYYPITEVKVTNILTIITMILSGCNLYGITPVLLLLQDTNSLLPSF